MLALSTAPWRISFRLTVQQAVDDGPGLLVIRGFPDIHPNGSILALGELTASLSLYTAHIVGSENTKPKLGDIVARREADFVMPSLIRADGYYRL